MLGGGGELGVVFCGVDGCVGGCGCGLFPGAGAVFPGAVLGVLVSGGPDELSCGFDPFGVVSGVGLVGVASGVGLVCVVSGVGLVGIVSGVGLDRADGLPGVGAAVPGAGAAVPGVGAAVRGVGATVPDGV